MKLTREQRMQFVTLGYELAKQARAKGWRVDNLGNDVELVTLEDLKQYEEEGKLKEPEPSTP